MEAYRCSLKDVLSTYSYKVWMKVYHYTLSVAGFIIAMIWYCVRESVSRDMDLVPFYLVLSIGVTLIVGIISFFVAREKVCWELYAAVSERMNLAMPLHKMELSPSELALVSRILHLDPIRIARSMHASMDGEVPIAS